MKETAFAHWGKEQKHNLSVTCKEQPLLIAGESKNTTSQSHERNSLCSLRERAKTQPFIHVVMSFIVMCSLKLALDQTYMPKKENEKNLKQS